MNFMFNLIQEALDLCAGDLSRCAKSDPEIERLSRVLAGVEIALARDENVEAAMKLILAAKR